METNLQKVHRTADTSRESFLSLTNEGRLIDEKKQCFEAILSHGPITSRRLAEVLRKERSNITRSVYDLLNEMNPAIKIAFKERCPKTGRRVSYYAGIAWKKESHAANVA